MSEKKWTEGPWRKAHRNANEILTTFHGVMVGKVFVDVTTENEREDSHLMAAAPRLYNALERLSFLHMCDEEGISSGQPTPKDWQEAIDEADTAMAEARGEQ